MNKIVIFLSLVLISSISKAQLPTQPTDVSPLMNGEIIPNTTLKNLEGKSVKIKGVLDKKPALLIFYRGGWCPFCNRQLAALQEVTEDFEKMGIQIIAISPDASKDMLETIDKNSLEYKLLSDVDLVFTQRMGLAYIDDDEALPVPSVYLVDKEGLIKFNYINPDYSVRPDPELILAAAKILIK